MGGDDESHAGTLVLMLPDMLHLLFVIGVVVVMLAMLSHMVYGYRVYHMSGMGMALNYWFSFTLFNFDRQDSTCVNALFV